MRVMAKTGAIVALVAALGVGLAACQSQGSFSKIATGSGDIGPASWLAKPEGDGPFPAVVLMHGCSGTERNTSHKTVWRGLGRHAALLNENGYVTLVMDSFGPRRITDGCRRPGTYYGVQFGDALAAFDHLAALPFVDRERIGFVGFSLGGGTALRMVHAGGSARKGQGNYAAYVAYYPYCELWFERFDRPVLILIGADDDWTPAPLCRFIHDRNADRVELVVYPDAHHSFDMPIPGVFIYEGHTVAGNGAARRDSQARMLAFFDMHLGPTH